MNDATKKQIEIYRNDIELEIALLLEQLQVDDPEKITHSKFNYMLSKIGKKLFYDKAKLKENSGLSNSNYYNIDLLESLYNIYIELCFIYNKVPSIDAFCLLCNIDNNSINNWKYEKTNSRQYVFYRKIMQDRESGLKNKCLDSSNILGIITVSNTEYSWNNNAGSVQHITNNIITADALPILKTTQKNILTKNE